MKKNAETILKPHVPKVTEIKKIFESFDNREKQEMRNFREINKMSLKNMHLNDKSKASRQLKQMVTKDIVINMETTESLNQHFRTLSS